jgi:hypothetical protein
MKRLMTRSIVLAFATFLLGNAACGPNPPGKLPVSSPVMSFEAPDEDSLSPADDDDSTDTDTTQDDSE